MFKRILIGACWLGLALAPQAQADCDGATPAQVKQAFAEGQRHEQAGRSAQAVNAYVQAQAYVCGGNPVIGDAVRRAAPLARTLAQAAERAGRLVGDDLGGAQPGAYQWYEAGGHYADADRALIQALRAKRDDIALFERAQRHFSERSLPAFVANNQPRLAVTGSYRFERALLDEVLAVPASNVATALEAEAKVLSEDYLRDYAAVLAARPANPRQDVAAALRAQQAHQQFLAKWRSDRIQESQAALHRARDWAVRAADRDQAEARVVQRAVQRGDLLLQKYAEAPELLEEAITYYQFANQEAKLAQARSRAGRLGDQAMQREHFDLAVSFYQLAGDDAKAEQANARAEEAAEKALAPMIEQQQRQAEQLRQQYSPEQVEALRAQAEEAQRRLQKTSAQQKQFQKETDDLEKELDLD